MLAPLLGLNLPFRRSLSAVLMSFAVTSAIFGAFSPLVAFLLWNAPLVGTNSTGLPAYNFILLLQVALVAFAGTAGNLRLFQLLARAGGSRAVARRVLCAWLAGNFLLGSQLSWILRPFVGSPNLPVEFLRRDAFHGNFYETAFHSLQHLLQLH
jgi:hypothetical protein